ncbi:MAG: hypothetical protein WAL90_13890 [Desulfobacterales bacterium]
MNQKNDFFYWLGGGTETCEHCGQLYVYEMEFRCGACDRPVCPLCARAEWGEKAACPECCREEQKE